MIPASPPLTFFAGGLSPLHHPPSYIVSCIVTRQKPAHTLVVTRKGPSRSRRPLIAYSAAMHLLNLTLQPATAVSAATVGSFSGAKGQEILVVRGGTRLEMLKLNTTSGQRESSPCVSHREDGRSVEESARGRSGTKLTCTVDTLCTTEVSFVGKCYPFSIR
jgi:hypothetical protein